ncbi:MAG TPA: lytic murein transglycosylase [Hyphomonadaceae bacterium]|nr:lytic murein transglycosylase [Hyphomonadaceae bacterium]
MSRSTRCSFAAVAIGLLMTACETTEDLAGAPIPRPNSPAPPGVDSPGNGPPAFSFQSSGDSNFDRWRMDFASKAQSAGRKTSSINQVLDGLTPIEESVQVQSFDNQAEFVKPIWDYARSAVSPTRISNGQARLADNKSIFDAIEGSYATPREIVAAIWGMETSYGAIIGSTDAPRAIASQAAIGRRKDFNEDELMAIMRLIEDGSATRDDFRRASWAGAVGQTQFMPSTFVSYGRDFDRDGRKDLWSNTGDALASAANYLTAMGWRQGQPWAVETRIPEGFDYSLGDGRKHTVEAWKTLGLTPATAPVFANSDGLTAELFLPAGSYGPAFLLFDNFFVIKRSNNADSYALAVGLLADRLAGRADLSRPWPVDITLLTQAQVKELQTGLNALGFNAGAVDGVIGRGTRGALQRFQKANGHVADGFPTTEMLEKVIAANGASPTRFATPAAAPVAPATAPAPGPGAAAPAAAPSTPPATPAPETPAAAPAPGDNPSPTTPAPEASAPAITPPAPAANGKTSAPLAPASPSPSPTPSPEPGTPLNP